MNIYLKYRNINLLNNIFRNFSVIKEIKGVAASKKNRDVTLRGSYIKGRFDDLPNLLFFSEACDPVENWAKFFTDPNNKVLDYRNVYLVNPRNFGNSDRNPSYDLEDQANDVVRFMYQNKISTATLAGHGYGGKLALATGCYHFDRVSGVYAIETSPMDHRYHDAYKEFKGYIEAIRNGGVIKLDDKARSEFFKNNIRCPKWRSIFKQQLQTNDKGQLEFKFDLESLYKNVNFNKADAIGNWNTKYGLFPGRAHFIFSDYSQWVHLNTNTLPMIKVCPRVVGFGKDIFSIQGDENPLNHWIYDFEQQSFTLDRKFAKFLKLWDGVHVLLKDRSEIGNYFVQDRKGSRNDGNHIYSDYSPSHYHHNWRFNNIYQEADAYENKEEK